MYTKCTAGRKLEMDVRSTKVQGQIYQAKLAGEKKTRDGEQAMGLSIKLQYRALTSQPNAEIIEL